MWPPPLGRNVWGKDPSWQVAASTPKHYSGVVLIGAQQFQCHKRPVENIESLRVSSPQRCLSFKVRNWETWLRTLQQLLSIQSYNNDDKTQNINIQTRFSLKDFCYSVVVGWAITLQTKLHTEYTLRSIYLWVCTPGRVLIWVHKPGCVLI